MQTRSASLLANQANPDTEFQVRSSFPEILKQLTVREAKLLDRVFADTFSEQEGRKTAPQLLPYMQGVAPQTFLRVQLGIMYHELGLTEYDCHIRMRHATLPVFEGVPR